MDSLPEELGSVILQPLKGRFFQTDDMDAEGAADPLSVGYGTVWYCTESNNRDIHGMV